MTEKVEIRLTDGTVYSVEIESWGWLTREQHVGYIFRLPKGKSTHLYINENVLYVTVPPDAYKARACDKERLA